MLTRMFSLSHWIMNYFLSKITEIQEIKENACMWEVWIEVIWTNYFTIKQVHTLGEFHISSPLARYIKSKEAFIAFLKIDL